MRYLDPTLLRLAGVESAAAVFPWYMVRKHTHGQARGRAAFL